jgi:hypothetical protein
MEASKLFRNFPVGVLQAVSNFFFHPITDPGSMFGQITSYLWWTVLHWDGFSPIISVSPANPHILTAPHSLIILSWTSYSLDADGVVK